MTGQVSQEIAQQSSSQLNNGEMTIWNCLVEFGNLEVAKTTNNFDSTAQQSIDHARRFRAQQRMFSSGSGVVRW